MPKTFANLEEVFAALHQLAAAGVPFHFEHNGFSAHSFEGLALYVTRANFEKAAATLPEVFAGVKPPRYEGATVYMPVHDPVRERRIEQQAIDKAARPSMDKLKDKIAAAKEAAKGRRKRKAA